MSKFAYRPTIDGLRAVAVISVILFHTGYDQFAGGFLGVDIFFVISGFVVTTSILPRIRSKTFTLAYFYNRRIKRIAPAFSLTLWSTIVIVSRYMPPDYVAEFYETVVAATFGVSNIYFFRITDYFEEQRIPQALLHTWTLGVEEQFYLVLPIFLSKLSTKSWVPTGSVLCVISFILSELSVTSGHKQMAFYLLPFRFWEFLFGMILALLDEHVDSTISRRQTAVTNVASLCLLTGSMVIVTYWNHHPGFMTILPILSTAIIIFNSRRPDGILSNSGMVFVGKISYSLYLWHFPIFIILGRSQTMFTTMNAYNWVVLITVVFLLSIVSYQLVEQPFRRLDTSFACTAMMWLGSVTITVAIAFVMLVNVHQSSMLDASYNFDRCNRNDEDYCPIRNCCENKTFVGFDNLRLTRLRRIEHVALCNSKFTDRCIVGSEHFKPTIALIGDSHATQYHYNLYHEMIETNASFSIESFSIDNAAVLKNLKCYLHGDLTSGQMPQLLEKVRKDQYKVVIFSQRWLKYIKPYELYYNEEGGTDPNTSPIFCRAPYKKFSSLKVLKDAIETIEMILSWNKTLILVYPTPETGINVPAIINVRLLSGNMKFFTTKFSAFMKYSASVYDAFDRLNHKRLLKIKPHEKLCDNLAFRDRCLLHDCRYIYYWDSNHFTDHGAKLITPEIMKLVHEAHLTP